MDLSSLHKNYNHLFILFNLDQLITSLQDRLSAYEDVCNYFASLSVIAFTTSRLKLDQNKIKAKNVVKYYPKDYDIYQKKKKLYSKIIA